MGLLLVHLLLDCWWLAFPTPGPRTLSDAPVLTAYRDQAPLTVHTQDQTLLSTCDQRPHLSLKNKITPTVEKS